MRTRSITLRSLLMFLVWPACALQAQRVTGTVRDSGSAIPLAGAVVVLLDTAGSTLARGLSDANGRYALVRAASAARLRVIRIGFQPRIVSLGNAGALVDVVMVRIPPMLAPVEVSSKALCSEGPDRKRAAAFWEQARAGLLAAVVAREANPAFATLLTYTRSTALNDGHVLKQQVKTASGTTTRPFLALDTPRQLADRGYIQEDTSGRVYKAPDADVLLDESFAETHCFAVVPEDAEHPGAIGLSFEPAQGRDSLVDVRGVLWLDAGVLALRAMEFRFTQLEPAAIRSGAGGALRFHAMRNGVVFIEEWSMRLPVLKEDQSRSTARIDQMARGQDASGNNRRISRIMNRTVVQMNETGGIVMGAAWSDSLRYQKATASLVGVVRVDRSSMPIAGVVVALDGTSDSVRTDSAGRFAFHPVISGRYIVTATDTAFASYTNPRRVSSSMFVPDARETELLLQLPSRASAMSRLCDGQRVPENSVILFGTVVADALFDFRGVSVESDWLNQFSTTSDGRNALINRADQLSGVSPKGRFRVCGVPEQRKVRLMLRRDGRPIADTSVVAPPGNGVFSVQWTVIRKAGAR